MIDNLSTTEKQITRCPICQGGFLLVEKAHTEKERLHCPICGVKFRAAESSEQLMFLSTPINFPGDLVGLWLTRAEMGKALHEYRMEANNNGFMPNKQKLPLENPIRAQAVRQARELVANGKSEEYVHGDLSSHFQLTDFAIEEIIQDAVAVSKACKELKREKFLKISLLVFLLILVLSVLIYQFIF